MGNCSTLFGPGGCVDNGGIIWTGAKNGVNTSDNIHFAIIQPHAFEIFSAQVVDRTILRTFTPKLVQWCPGKCA